MYCIHLCWEKLLLAQVCLPDEIHIKYSHQVYTVETFVVIHLLVLGLDFVQNHTNSTPDIGFI